MALSTGVAVGGEVVACKTFAPASSASSIETRKLDDAAGALEPPAGAHREKSKLESLLKSSSRSRKSNHDTSRLSAKSKGVAITRPRGKSLLSESIILDSDSDDELGVAPTTLSSKGTDGPAAHPSTTQRQRKTTTTATSCPSSRNVEESTNSKAALTKRVRSHAHPKPNRPASQVPGPAPKCPPPTLKPKPKAQAKPPRKTHGLRLTEINPGPLPRRRLPASPPPPPEPLPTLIAAKLAHIKTYLTSTKHLTNYQRAYTRHTFPEAQQPDTTSSTAAITANYFLCAPALNLTAAILRLQLDFCTLNERHSDASTTTTPLKLLHPLIVSQFHALVQSHPYQKWLVLDLSRPFYLEQEIRANLARHGCELPFAQTTGPAAARASTTATKTGTDEPGAEGRTEQPLIPLTLLEIELEMLHAQMVAIENFESGLALAGVGAKIDGVGGGLPGVYAEKWRDRFEGFARRAVEKVQLGEKRG